MKQRSLVWIVAGIFVLALPFAAYWKWNASLIDRLHREQPQMFVAPVVDSTPPRIGDELPHPAILVFSKTNGYRHKDAIAAGNRLLQGIATKNAWGIFATENAAVYNDEQLAHFSVLVWNNPTRPELTNDQQQALLRYIEGGGGFVGVHAAGDNSHAGWSWYQSQVIRARFLGHPMWPQFSVGKITVENVEHAVVNGLPSTWEHEEEWYSFRESPRQNGVTVLATVDEDSYRPGRLFEPMRFRIGRSLAMGSDHPVIWLHTEGQGRVFYTALGHQAEAYENPQFRLLLEQAIIWAGRLNLPFGESDKRE